MELPLSVRGVDGSESRLDYDVRRVVLCGMTGPEDEVRRHVAELEEAGIPVPDEVPATFPFPRQYLVFGSEIDVLSPETSGEVEYVLFPTDDEVYVGVGSDHTDRALETEDVVLSKTVCPNVVSEHVWKLDAVEDHWNELTLSSRTGADRPGEPYQRGGLDRLMGPRELLDLVADRVEGPLAGTVVFSGTISTSAGELVHGSFFAGRLHDPVLDRSLDIDYDVSVTDWLE